MSQKTEERFIIYTTTFIYLRLYHEPRWMKSEFFRLLLEKFFQHYFEDCPNIQALTFPHHHTSSLRSTYIYVLQALCFLQVLRLNLLPLRRSHATPILYNSITSRFFFTTIIKCTCNVIMKYSLLFLLILSLLASYYGLLINMFNAILNKNKRCVKN